MSVYNHVQIRDFEISISERFANISWPFFILLCIISSFGFVILFSIAEGNFSPWASKQMLRFLFGMGIAIFISVTDIRIWMKYAYLLYFVSLILIIMVAFTKMGDVGMGAQRWLKIGFIRIQPSEIIKITSILALARYFHGTTSQEIQRFDRNPMSLIPLMIIGIPTLFILRQPDLGTAMLLVGGGIFILFLVGVPMRDFVISVVLMICAVPAIWPLLKDYQKHRVLAFLDPEIDPLGKGYHISQAKIALGSGGVFGKGYMQGTQSHLNFIPEIHTDFIFTVLAEEFGMIGGIALLVIFTLLMVLAFIMAFKCHSFFAKILILGLSYNFFLHYLVNMGMVMGILPVVGVPLPLISYGGTSMLTLMFGFGLLMCAYTNREVIIGRRGHYDDE